MQQDFRQMTKIHAKKPSLFRLSGLPLGSSPYSTPTVISVTDKN